MHWVEVGGDFMERGLVVMPILGLVAIGRGMMVAVLAVLFGVFSCGLLQRRSWARGLGIFLSLVTLLLVVSAVIHGVSLAWALVWAIIPVVILCYLMSPSGRHVLNVDAQAQWGRRKRAEGELTRGTRGGVIKLLGKLKRNSS